MERFKRGKMSDSEFKIDRLQWGKFRDWFADSLGVGPERKEEIYLDISRSASVRDLAYWLQLLFAAGVATLGLTLNSPAVIIGAMLISPLMGPILASGLALAAGDLVLGLRAGAVLALSCLTAILFSILLVGLLPFKEMTNEIAARTQPNTLDLFVALFSGAIGSIAISKEVKGVVTSIPGVAIAVALMPPLCVVGYGFGLAISLDAVEGLRVARGGGLLFLTNLVAITFTAMMVFLALHIDIPSVKKRVREWRHSHEESRWVRAALVRFRISDQAGNIGGVPARLLSIAIPLILVAIPLTQSLNQLKREVNQQRTENQFRRVATDVWQQSFAKLPNGEIRSYVDQLTVSELNNQLSVYLRVFTSKPYTPAERQEWTRQIAARLGRSPESIGLQLIEIPTASGELTAIARDEKRVQTPPTVAELRANFWQGVESALRDLRLPPAVQLVNYRVITGGAEPVEVVLNYLCDHELDADTQALIAQDIRARFSDPAAKLSLVHLASSFGPIQFNRSQASLSTTAMILLDQIGQSLVANPGLRVEIAASAENREPAEIANLRVKAISDYLAQKWQIASGRIASVTGTGISRSAMLRLKVAETGTSSSARLSPTQPTPQFASAQSVATPQP